MLPSAWPGNAAGSVVALQKKWGCSQHKEIGLITNRPSIACSWQIYFVVEEEAE